MRRKAPPWRAGGFLHVVPIILVLASFAARSAEKAPPPADGRLAAIARQAEAEYNLGDFRGALVKFEALYKETGKAALLFNVAQCHRQLGDLQQAAVNYR